VSSALKKCEILKNVKIIDKIFENKKFIKIDFLKFKFLELDEKFFKKNQFFFSVSKKKIAKAVDRNLIKRRIKEAFRKKKNYIVNVKKNICLAIIYNSSYIKSYKDIQDCISEFLININNFLN
jgi:ribonuclease P protein component